MTDTDCQQRRGYWAEVLGIPPDYAEKFQLNPIDECDQLIEIGSDVFGRPQKMEPSAADAWHKMAAGAQHVGIDLHVVSAFRSIDYQAGLIEKKLAAGQCLEDVLKVSAAPGFSEHHSGRALDLTTTGDRPLETSFAQTPAYAWLKEHAKTYGFQESFGPNNRHGLIWEPWHWCYQPFLMAA